MKIKIPFFLICFFAFNFISANAQQRLFAGRLSSYSTEYDTYPYGWSAYQILGKPNVYPAYGDIADAFNPAEFGVQRDFIELEFDNHGPIDSIFIYETFTPGFVDSVFVKNPGTQNWELMYSAIAAPAPATARILAIGFPMTSYDVSELRLTLANDTSPDWVEIDAVGISPATTNPFTPETTPGSAYNFDGIDDAYHTYSNLSNLINNNAATFTAWINIHQNTAPVTTDVYDGAGVLCDADGTYLGVYLANQFGADSLYFYNYDGSDDYFGMNYTPDTWFHIAWVHTGGYLKAYKNGIIYDSIVSGNTDYIGMRPLEIGFNLNSTQYFEGEIDEVTTFDRGLSASEIYQVMRMNVPANMLGLTGYWQMSNCDESHFFNPKNHIADSLEGVFCTASGVPDYTSSESTTFNVNISVYPNPANEVIHINVSDIHPEYIAVYDIMGKLMYENVFISSPYQISIEDISAGVYSILITDANKKTHTIRFIKN